jgi:protein TonB
MFDDVLIESAGKVDKKATMVTAVISAVAHIAIVGAVVAAGMYVKENPEVIEKPISAFIVTSPPPPPPPPPPPASNAGATTPRVVEIETPRERPDFRQPDDVPQDLPDVSDVPSTSTRSREGGVVGGVEGGVAGGVVGGVVGGVQGGVLGGVEGGQIGGTGTGNMPVRVGGNVKAPVIIESTRIKPVYSEVARRARIQGLVIIEAVIDRQGNVTEARVLKPLPMGLDNAALNAVKQWKFKPGTLNGQPVPVYYNLTVNFAIE